MQSDNVAAKSENMDWYDGPTFMDSLDVKEAFI
jgi:sulfate adenylyltransferase subunit 1 (EFTu-like GTPase family)